MSVRQRILRGVGANVFGQGVNVLVQVVGLPVFLAVWGVEKYGEWLVLSSLAAFLSMSDVGFATAAANEMTMRVGRGDRDGALVVYQSMWALLCGLGGLMLLAVAALLWLTPAAGWVPVTHTSASTVAAVLTILAAYVLVGQQVAVLQAGFRCDGAYALGQSLGAGMRLVEFAAQATAAAFTGSMVATAAAALASRSICFVLIAITLSRRSPWLRHGVTLADRAEVRALFTPALAFMGMPLGYAIANQGTVQVVAAVLGPAMLVVFSAHRTVANIGIQCITLVNQAVRPEVSLAFGAGDLPAALRLNRKLCQLTLWAAVACSLALALFAVPLFWVWTQGQLSVSYPLLAPLLAVVVLRSTWLSSYVVPSATNRHVRIAGLFLTATLVSLAAAVMLTPMLGLPGAALSLVLTELAMSLFVFRVSVDIVGDTLEGFLKNVLTPPRLPRNRLLCLAP